MAANEEIKILIQSLFDAQGAAAATTAFQGVGTSAAAMVAELRAAAAAAGSSETEFLAAAGSLSTMALAAGDAAGAEAILAEAMNGSAAAAGAQAAGVEADTAAIGGMEAAAQGATAAVGALGLAMGGVIAAKMAADLIVTGAEAQRTETRFDALAVSAHTTGAALLSALRTSSGGEIADQALELDTMKASLLGVGQSAEQLAPLMTLARDRAQQMGLTTEQAFERLVTGLGRGSAKILDDLGIVVHVTQINEAYAASIGKTADALTDVEKKQALVNEVVRQGAASAAASGGAIDGNAASVQRLGASWENLKDKIGGTAANAAAPMINSLSDLASGLDGTAQTAGGFAVAIQNVTAAMGGMAPISAQTQAANQNFAAGLLEMIGVSSGVAPAISTMSGAFDEDRAAAAALANTIPATATAINDGTVAINTGTMALQAHAAEYAMLIGVTEQSVQASMADSAAKDELAAKTGLLTAQTTAAISAFMALHPNISAAGVAAMAAAGQIDPLLAQLIQATLRAREAASALAAFNALQGVKASRVVAGEQEAEVQGYKHAAVEADRAERQKTNAARDEAEKQRTITLGTHDQKVALAQKEYDAQVKLYGAGSTQAYQYQTKLMQAQEQGASKRAASAGTAGAKIESIEQKTGDKIAQIVENTQKKITAIDEREAAKQAAALRKLNEDIATMTADRRASNEADDLDLIGVKDSKEAAKLNDRERAEASARQREKQAEDEARAQAEAGDAETAQKTLAIREKQINDQQALDEKYYEKQRELAGDPASTDALKQQYDEATRANEEAAQVRVDMANQEAEQKKAAVQAEKDAVIAAANEQANQVASAAERGMNSVKNATGAARAQGVSDLHAIGDAVNAIPSSKTITITVKQDGNVGASSTGGGGGTNKAAGGGTFATHGPTTLTVGDNPGGQEIVTVTPVSGRGTSSASGNLVKLAGGGVVLVDAGGGYTTPIAGSGGGGGGGGKGGGGGGGGAAGTKDLKDQLAEQKSIVELLRDLIQLRGELEAAVNQQPFNVGLITNLAKKAAMFLEIVQGTLVPITKDDGEAFKRYADAAKSALSIIGDVAKLREQMQENADDQPFDMNLIRGLARRAGEFVQIVQAQLVPTSEAASDGFSHYRDAVGDAVGILGDVAKLRDDLSKVGKTPFDMRQIAALADDAKRITVVVQSRLLPTSKEQAEALSEYSSAVGSSVSAVKDVLDLGGKLFTDYVSPSDSQLAMIANDAKRITKSFFDAGKLLGKDGAEAGKTYAEGVGAAFSAAKDGLLVIDALKSGDFVLPPAALQRFQKSSMDILATMQALGGRAAKIPAGDIAALQTVTAAVSGQAEALIKMAAVPFGDLPGASQGFAQSGGALGGAGGTTVTNYNTFNLPPGSNQQTAQEVIRLLNQQTGARRG